jgi:hypothetical protein
MSGMPRQKPKDQKFNNYPSLAGRILKIRDIALSPGSHFENVPTWGFTHYKVKRAVILWFRHERWRIIMATS